MKTLDSLAKTRHTLSDRVAKWQLTVEAFPGLFESIEEKVEPRFDPTDGTIGLMFNGSASDLSEVWKHLRIAGFRPDTNPRKGDITFATFWRPSEAKRYATIWMYFTSSVCKRVQVGTRMVEEPIYETQCSSELDSLLPAENDNPLARE